VPDAILAECSQPNSLARITMTMMMRGVIVMRHTTHGSFDVGIASYGAFSKHMKLVLGLTF
jgi:hypothetical protein